MTWGVRGVVVRFGSTTALDGVDLTVEPGRIHAVIGGDGSGKSTLLRVLAGVGISYQGSVRRPPTGQVGFVSGGGGVFPDLTVDENIEFMADVHGLAHWRDRSRRLLEGTGIAAFGDRLAGRLSGGERRKLAGAMALLSRPELLVLDELTTGVDPLSRVEIWRLMAGAAAAGTAVVTATTYLDEAERAGSVLMLHRGRPIAWGTPEAIVEGVSGVIEDLPEPDDPDRAWRRGRGWRQWRPEVPRKGRGTITLEEAAIVAELAAEQGGRP